MLLGLLRHGQTVALAEDAYYGVGMLVDDLGRWGLAGVDFDQTGAPPDGADLVWLEAPSNPLLTFPISRRPRPRPRRCSSTRPPRRPST